MLRHSVVQAGCVPLPVSVTLPSIVLRVGDFVQTERFTRVPKEGAPSRPSPFFSTFPRGTVSLSPVKASKRALREGKQKWEGGYARLRYLARFTTRLSPFSPSVVVFSRFVFLPGCVILSPVR